MTEAQRQTAEDRSWLCGYICALVALAPYGDDTIFDDVVEGSGDVNALIKRARRDGAMRWSGLSGYVRREAQRNGE